MFRKIAFVCMMALTALAHAAVTDLICTQTAPTEYKLSYTLTGDSHKVQIFASTDPAGAGMQRIQETSSNQVTVNTGKPGDRMYFFLKPDHGEQREVSIRRLPLEGTPNFRDLGGYKTIDGRFIQWGKVYRAGVLSYLTSADLIYLSQLDIRVVCDFRTVKENADAPEKWINGANTMKISLPIGTDEHNKDATNSLQELLATNPAPAELTNWMSKIYVGFVFRSAPEYAQVFAQLKDGHLPLLYHCTAGRDRTGVFSALLLLTLGVPEQTVISDYALTDQYLLSGPTDREPGASLNKLLSNMTPDQKKGMFDAGPVYLKSTLRAIDEKYESFDNYRRQVLGVSDSDVEKLRDRLLTK